MVWLAIRWRERGVESGVGEGSKLRGEILQ